MDVTQKLKIGKVVLIQNQPFYASLVLRMKISPDDSIETACTDGTQIWYSPAFFDELTTAEVAAVLAHEVMHIAHLHHTRMKNREHKRWNRACDYAINPILVKSGLQLPEGCLLDDAYAGMSAEQIYPLLEDEPPDQSSACGMGEVIPPPAGTDVPAMESQARRNVAQAATDARLKRNLPEHLERLVDEILSPKIDWRTLLIAYLTELTRDDYSWKQPSKRYLCRGLYMPTLESRTIGAIILLVDTSASIDEAMINQFAAEVQEIATMCVIPLQVIYVDSVVHNVQDIDPDDPIQLHPEGGGGTDFRPGFVYIDEQDLHPQLVIYLTDGECHSFPEEPDYPVLWAQFGQYPFDPPFGDVIQVE